jgi:DNA topoisomerase-3
MGKSALFRVTSVTGHVFSMDFPPQYQQWDAVEPVELFSAPVISITEGKGGIVKHLEREAQGVDYLVLWLDCDREGENICFEVIRCCEKSMNKGVRGQRIFRAKFSAVTPKDIAHAMRNLVEPNENESKAVEARQELDLKVGVAFSRFQTRYFQGKYGDLDSAVISYGPCQTPTLGFCVDRYDEIQTFTSEPFWSLATTIEAVVTVPASSTSGTSSGTSSGTTSSSSSTTTSRMIEVGWSRDRLFDQNVAETFLSLVSEDGSLVCTEVKVFETRRTRPQPMNTVELLKLASRVLGIGPHAAMRAAEQLYLSGYVLSYNTY